MGASGGLIIAFVVVVWAAYFIPLALRRYDDASKNASVETSGSASRLIKRPQAAGARGPSATETAPSRSVPSSSVPSSSVPSSSVPSRPVADRPAARLAAKRRRRTLLVLLGLTMLVGGLAGFAVIAPLWVAAPAALVILWLMACRIQVRGERGLAAVPSGARLPRIKVPHVKMPSFASLRTASPSAPAVALSSDEEETIIVSGHFEDINPGRKNLMEDVELEADALDDKIVIAVPSVSTTGEALWDPLPVTLPTYVTKPRAGRTVRTIDFGQAGVWTSGHIEGEDVEMPHRVADVTGDERRAVGH